MSKQVMTNFVILIYLKTGLVNFKSNGLKAQIRESRPLIINVLGSSSIAIRCPACCCMLSILIKLINKITDYFGD